MDKKPPHVGEEPPHHVQAREIGAVLDATVFSPFNAGLAWLMAFTQTSKPSKEADSPL